MNSFHRRLKFIIAAFVGITISFTCSISYARLDAEAGTGKTAVFPISAVTATGTEANSFEQLNEGLKPIKPTISKVQDSVVNSGNGVYGYKLHDNFPNPFESKTEIKFSLYYSSNIHIVISDLTGSRVVTLTDGYYEAGEHSVIFNNSVYGLPAGVYYYSLMTGDYNTTKRMVICR
jgi:hypothetical protein